MFLKHFLYSGLLLLLLLASSCSDKFLEVIPPDAGDQTLFAESAADVKEVLNSAFAALTYEDFYGGKVQLANELMADNLNPVSIGNQDWKSCYDRSVGVFNSLTGEILRSGYKAVNRANFVLDNIDRFTELEEGERTRIKAEARFVRAIVHFELVRLFAHPYGFAGQVYENSYTNNEHPGIPLVMSYTTQPQPRASVAAVYAAIIDDLKFAEANLAATEGFGGKGHPTLYSAQGFLAKVYFQMNDFSNAYTYADKVIGSGAFAMDSLQARFSSAWSSENVFALYSSDAESDNASKFLRNQFAFDPNANKANLAWSKTLFDVVNKPGDQRAAKWFATAGIFVYGKKLTVGSNTHNPICHLTELKLIRAESAGELQANLPTGLADLNDIRNRAGVGALSNDTPAGLLITEARVQRQIELHMEGNRLQELKRIGALLFTRGDNSFTIRSSPWNCAGLLYQFHTDEFKGNFIEPNPYGGC